MAAGGSGDMFMQRYWSGYPSGSLVLGPAPYNRNKPAKQQG